MRKLILMLLVIVTAAPVIAAEPNALDKAAHTYFSGNDRIGKHFKWFGNHVMGNGAPNLLLGGLFWGYGAWQNHPKEKYAGIAQVETVLATGLTVNLIKQISKRARPDGSDKLAFPSAHAAYAFATASVLGDFYGWKVGVPVYALAILTMAARMEDNRHWFTDTLGGAAIGVGYGLLFSNINKKHWREATATEETLSVQAAPLIHPGAMGASLTFSF